MPDTSASDAHFTVESVNQFKGALADRMGIHFTEVSRDRVVATMPVEGNTQPYGLLHGGASAVLAETVGSVHAALYAGADRVALGVTINAIHHRAVRSGAVTATCTPLQTGRTMATFAIAIHDEEQRLVCSSTLVCQLRDSVVAAKGAL